MWRLWRFIPPHQEVHHDADDDHQNSSDDNQAMRHSVYPLGVMLHKRDLMGKEGTSVGSSASPFPSWPLKRKRGERQCCRCG